MHPCWLKMASFDTIPAGQRSVEIDGSSSPGTTVPGSPKDLPKDPAAWTPTQILSDSDCEIISVKEAPKLPNVEMEMQLMSEHERYGHYYRVIDRQAAVDQRLKRIRDEAAAESPSTKMRNKLHIRRMIS